MFGTDQTLRMYHLMPMANLTWENFFSTCFMLGMGRGPLKTWPPLHSSFADPQKLTMGSSPTKRVQQCVSPCSNHGTSTNHHALVIIPNSLFLGHSNYSCSCTNDNLTYCYVIYSTLLHLPFLRLPMWWRMLGLNPQLLQSLTSRLHLI